MEEVHNNDELKVLKSKVTFLEDKCTVLEDHIKKFTDIFSLLESNFSKEALSSLKLQKNEIKEIKETKAESLPVKEEPHIQNPIPVVVAEDNAIKLDKVEVSSLSKVKFNLWDKIRVSQQLPKNKRFFTKIAFWTICSSVATSSLKAKKRDITIDDDDSGMKAALFGAADDANNMHNYLMEKGAEYSNQGKFEFSSESVSSLSKESLFLALENYFNSTTNEGCIVYYSGHGFQDAKLLMETSQGSYYLDYEEIMQFWRKRSFPTKNKHLLLIMDCCYSGSWVGELLSKGDYTSVSIQASSTDKQKSNDLGKGKGSLFTNVFLHANEKSVYSLNIDDKTKEKMLQQQPVAFGFKDIGRQDFNFNNIISNSWYEMINPSDYTICTSKNSNFRLRFNSVKYSSEEAFLFSKYEHVVFVISEEQITCQFELYDYATQEKYICNFALKSDWIGKNSVGHLAIKQNSATNSNAFLNSTTCPYNKDNVDNFFSGKYFNTLRNSRRIFALQESQIFSCINMLSSLSLAVKNNNFSLLTNFIDPENTSLLNLPSKDNKDNKDNKDKINSINNKEGKDGENNSITDEDRDILIEESILNTIKLLTETNKVYLIEDDSANILKDDDDELDDLLNFEESSENPHIKCLRVINPDEKFNDADFCKHFNDKNFRLRKLFICNNNKNSLEELINYLPISLSIRSITLKLSVVNNVILYGLEKIITSMRLLKLSVEFTVSEQELQSSEVAITALKPFKYLFMLRSLKKAKFINLPRLWNIDLINTLYVEGLNTFILKKTSLNEATEFKELNQILVNCKKLKTLELIDCDLYMAPDFPICLENINLTENNLNNNQLYKILDSTKRFTNKFRVNLQNNCFTDTAFSNLKKYLARNSQCLEFNISKNLVTQKFYLDMTSILNTNNTLINLDLSFTVIENPSYYTNYLKNQKTIRTITVVKCGLVDSNLVKFTQDILNNELSNQVSHFNISQNTITSERYATEISRYIRYRNILESIIMDGCLDLDLPDNKKDYEIEKFFGNNSLQTINFSNWKIKNGGKFILSAIKVMRGQEYIPNLVNITLLNTDIDVRSDMSFKSTRIENLNVDYYLLKHFISSKIVKLNVTLPPNDEDRKDFYLLANSNLKTLDDISLNTINVNNLLDIYIPRKRATIRSEMITQINKLCSFNQINTTKKLVVNNLFVENIDKEAAILLIEHPELHFNRVILSDFNINWSNHLKIEYKAVKNIFNQYKAKFLIESTDFILPKDDYLKELFRITNKTNQLKIITTSETLTSYKAISFELMNHLSKKSNETVIVQNINSPFEKIDPSTNYLKLFSNYFSLKDFINTELILEGLELDNVYGKTFLNYLPVKLAKSKNIKILILRNLEINSAEIICLKNIVKEVSNTLEELHLINTFIDERESNSIFDALIQLKKLKVLNLSENYINKIFVWNFINYLETRNELFNNTNNIDTTNTDTGVNSNNISNENQLTALYLRNTSMSEESLFMILSKINSLNIDLDISGLKLSKEPYVSKTANFDNYNKQYSLRVNYSNIRLELDFNIVPPSNILVSLQLDFVDLDKIKHHLYSFLKSRKSLEILTINHCYSENMLVKLIYNLHTLCVFKTLNLHAIAINKKASKYISEIIEYESPSPTKERVSELTISNCQIEDENFDSILYSLNNSKLLFLNLHRNMLSRFSLINLIREILQNSKVAKIISIELSQSFSAELNEKSDFMSKLIYNYENEFSKQEDILKLISLNNSLNPVESDAIPVKQTELKQFEDKFINDFNDFNSVKEAELTDIWFGNATESKEYDVVNTGANIVCDVLRLDLERFVIGIHGSKACFMRVHLVDNGERLYTIAIPDKKLTCMSLLRENIVVSVSFAFLKLWNMNTYTCFKTFDIITQFKCMSVVSDDEVVLGFDYMSIYDLNCPELKNSSVTDSKSKSDKLTLAIYEEKLNDEIKKIIKLNNYESSTNCFIVAGTKSGKLFTYNYSFIDKTCSLIKINSSVITGEVSGIVQVYTNNCKDNTCVNYVTSSVDGSLILWNILNDAPIKIILEKNDNLILLRAILHSEKILVISGWQKNKNIKELQVIDLHSYVKINTIDVGDKGIYNLTVANQCDIIGIELRTASIYRKSLGIHKLAEKDSTDFIKLENTISQKHLTANNIVKYNNSSVIIGFNTKSANNNSIYLWNIEENYVIMEYPIASNNISSIVLHESSESFISADYSGDVKQFNISTGVCINTFSLATQLPLLYLRIEKIILHPVYNNLLYVVTHTSEIILIDLTSFQFQVAYYPRDKAFWYSEILFLLNGSVQANITNNGIFFFQIEKLESELEDINSLYSEFNIVKDKAKRESVSSYYKLTAAKKVNVKYLQKCFNVLLYNYALESANIINENTFVFIDKKFKMFIYSLNLDKVLDSESSNIINNAVQISIDEEIIFQTLFIDNKLFISYISDIYFIDAADLLLLVNTDKKVNETDLKETKSKEATKTKDNKVDNSNINNGINVNVLDTTTKHFNEIIHKIDDISKIIDITKIKDSYYCLSTDLCLYKLPCNSLKCSNVSENNLSTVTALLYDPLIDEKHLFASGLNNTIKKFDIQTKLLVGKFPRSKQKSMFLNYIKLSNKGHDINTTERESILKYDNEFVDKKIYLSALTDSANIIYDIESESIFKILSINNNIVFKSPFYLGNIYDNKVTPKDYYIGLFDKNNAEFRNVYSEETFKVFDNSNGKDPNPLFIHTHFENILIILCSDEMKVFMMDIKESNTDCRITMQTKKVNSFIIPLVKTSNLRLEPYIKSACSLTYNIISMLHRNEVFLWDITTGKLLVKYQTDFAISTFKISKYLLAVFAENLHLLNIPALTLEKTKEQLNLRLVNSVVKLNSMFCISAGLSSSIKIWN